MVDVFNHRDAEHRMRHDYVTQRVKRVCTVAVWIRNGTPAGRLLSAYSDDAMENDEQVSSATETGCAL